MDVNEIELKVTDSFFFRRFEKIDWKKIASVNLDHLKDKSSFNWNIIEENIGNILYCHLQSEFDSSSLDANLCKLFQLAQISIEYLLKIRQQLLTEVKCLQDKNENNKMKLNAAIQSKEETEKKYKELKKDSKKSSHQLYYRCPSCPKTFSNGDFLRGHWQRRHQHIFPMPEDIETASGSEQLMVNSIINKMDQSNVSLQEFVAHEIEKVRQEFEGKNSSSPATQSVGTQVSVISHSIATCTDEIHSSSIGTNTEDIRHASNGKPAVGSIVTVTATALQASKPDLSSDEAYDYEDSDVDAQVGKEIRPIDVNLKNSFKTSIRNALKDRMRMLGIEDNKSYYPSKTKRILQQIRSTSAENAEFQKLRHHFKTLLDKKLSSDFKKPRKEASERPSARKRLFPQAYPVSENKMESPKKHLVRPPVPTPRIRMEQSNVNSSFMARDGEASTVFIAEPQHRSTIPLASAMNQDITSGSELKTVKPLTHNLELQVTGESINVLSAASPKETETKSLADEDSFSLSSLDAILTELKRPQRFSSTGKSVQWKNPVEQAVRIDNSWDS